MITFNREELSKSVINELNGLVYLQQIELWEHMENGLDLDWDLYTELEEAGFFVLYTVRLGDRLIGYCSFTISPDMHYKGGVCAVQDSIYVIPLYRKMGAGVKLIDYCEEELRKDFNATSITHAVNKEVDFSGLLSMKGYEYTEKIMIKRFT